MKTVVQATGTLAAGTPASVDVAVGTHPTASAFTLVIKNTGGANAIGTVAIAKSPAGNLFVTDSTITVSSIAAGASALVEIQQSAAAVVRVTMTSASGTTYAVEARAASVV